MKKFLSFLIIVVLCFGFATSSAYADVSKISESKLSMNVGDTHTLKITGTTLKITWSSKNKAIATVSTKGKVTAKKEGKTIITAKTKAKSYSCKVEVNPSEQSMIVNICNYVTVNIWNHGFCDIEWYEGNGTDSSGNELDIDSTLNNLLSSMVQLMVYNTYMQSLDSDEYPDLISDWNDLYEESKSLYEEALYNRPVQYIKDDDFNTDNFIKYLDAFTEECSYFL